MKKDQAKRNLPTYVVTYLESLVSRFHPFLTLEDAEVIAMIAGCGALKTPPILAAAIAAFKQQGTSSSSTQEETFKAPKGDSQGKKPSKKRLRVNTSTQPYSPRGIVVKSIVTAFRDNPGASVGEIASIVYGPSDPLRLPKLRGFITTLRNRGVLQNFGVGRWRLTQKGLTVAETPEADVKTEEDPKDDVKVAEEEPLLDVRPLFP